MKLVAWTILLLATMIWTVIALVSALAMVGIGGAHAYGEFQFWVYALSPWPMIGLTAWTAMILSRDK